MTEAEFSCRFEELTGNRPLRWQWRLFRDHFAIGNLCDVIDLPTGLGKTMVMAIWLIAQEDNNALGRRLVYVVDRRTVVDQATDLAVKLQEKCGSKELAISTLRGQLADNRDWSRDPSKPAIIIGTVDLIGSALLFSGYRSSYKRRPLEAGLLGQDSLLVLDEAHLSKPFEKLVCAIKRDGTFQRGRDGTTQGAPMCVIRMSATSGEATQDKIFRLDTDPNSATFDIWSKIENGKETNAIKQRFEARKRLAIKASTNVVDAIASEASNVAAVNPGSRIVIFVKTPKDVNAVRNALIKKDKSRETKIARLTGTMRGLERDELVDLKAPIQENQHERRVMQRFLNPNNDPAQGESFLVSTSAGEVGFDLNADHLVGDAAPLDSWIQRLGRVNRRGNGDATVILIKEKDPTDKTEFDKACIATTNLLGNITDVSPKALAAFKKLLTPGQIGMASSPEPAMVELTDILLDAWSMTSIIAPMPGRPEVAPWLRGIANDLPHTTIAWRAELDESGFAQLRLESIEEWFETHRVLTHETLSVPTTVAAKWFGDRWNNLNEDQKSKVGPRPIVVDRAGLKLITVKELIVQLARKGNDSTSAIRNADVVLPASFGGIERGHGLLDADSPIVRTDELQRSNDEEKAASTPDVADDRRDRYREIVSKTEEGAAVPPRRIGTGVEPKNPSRLMVDLEPVDDQRVTLISYVLKREKPEWGSKKQTLSEHVGLVRKRLDEILTRLDLPDWIKITAQLSADWHDHGKNRERWQRCVDGMATTGTTDWIKQLRLESGGRYQTLGKSGGDMKRDPRGYRHEFGSLREFLDAHQDAMFADGQGNDITRDVIDLAAHLIATHHGRGRPHFPNGGFDPSAERRSSSIHTEAIRRFARLQDKYGHWRLAWLENLLRCADALASVNEEVEDDTDKSHKTAEGAK